MTELFVALRALILQYVTTEVIQGLGNGVPTPLGGFIVMTESSMMRLATNTYEWADPAIIATQSAKVAIQVDCYGPDSGEWAGLLSTIFRSPVGADAGIFYCDDPKQAPMTNAEAQYVRRWTFDVHMSHKPTATIPTQFMDTATVTIRHV